MIDVMPSSPRSMGTNNSKKRRRSIEPLATTKVIGLPLATTHRIQDALVTAAPSTNTFPLTDETVDQVDDVSASKLMRRSLMGLSLQLKLKTMLVEAWASDMNTIVIERNLFAIAKEVAILKEMGVYEEGTCMKFVDLARQRMADLLAERECGETLRMEASQMWTMASIEAQANMCNLPTNATVDTSEFPLLSRYDASSRDISVLWKAMSIARDRGAQLWHENKPEQALPFLVAADSYMKRFTLKYQRLKIDHAMLDSIYEPSSTTTSAPQSPRPATKHVSFAKEPQVLGTADASIDRSPINPTKPSKLESLLLRTSREFPTPSF